MLKHRTTSPFFVLFCLCVVAPVLSATAAGKIDYADPPQGVFIDEWMIVELEGRGRMGYNHTQISRQGDVINSQNQMSFSLARTGQALRISVLQNTNETLDGRLLDFDHKMNFSAQQMVVSGRIDGDKVFVTSTQFGQATKAEYDYPQGAVMSWGLLLMQDKMGYAPGTEYTVQMYDPATAAHAALEMKVEIHGSEEIDLAGKTVRAVRATHTFKMPNLPMEMRSTTWLDENGSVLRMTMDIAGMSMLMSRTTKAEALKGFSPPEFFTPTIIKVDRRIDRARARRIDYLLQLGDKGGKMPPLPETAMQKPGPPGDAEVRVTVARLDHDKLRNAPAAPYGDEFKEFLAPNAIVNCEDPAVKRMAAKAKGDARAPYAIADKLRKFVTEVITEKNLNIGFATASEVCRNKEGDCTEHAVLLAALGRACGIPSRVATGIVYVPVFGGKRDIFGFHMWTQFRIGETWVDFDAAQRESDCNPTHIAFGVDSLHGGGLGQIVFPMIDVIGNLKLTVERIDPPPDKQPTTTSNPHQAR